MSASVATITSRTSPAPTRSSRSGTWMSSGPTPSMGEITPCRTWYRPWSSAVRSIASTSSGDSTTHTRDGSRRVERQMAPRSPSAMFQQRSQYPMRVLTSTIARASASARPRSARRMWHASRCAVLGPTLGSRDSSWISSSRAAGSCGTPGRPRLEQARGQAQARCDGLHALGGEVPRPVHPLVHRRHDEVLQHLDVVAGHVRVDRDRQQLLLAVDHHFHGAAAGRGLDLFLLELGLDLGHLGLHLLDLLEHLHLVLHQGVSFNGRTRTTFASNFLSAALISGSSSGASARAGAACCCCCAARGAASWRRRSSRAPSPSQDRSSGSTWPALSIACLWWKLYGKTSTRQSPSTRGLASRKYARVFGVSDSRTRRHPSTGSCAAAAGCATGAGAGAGAGATGVAATGASAGAAAGAATGAGTGTAAATATGAGTAAATGAAAGAGAGAAASRVASPASR